VITPDTPLETLEIFLQKNLFALGMSSHCSLQCPILTCPIVTDRERKFVLGVATQHDLDVRLTIAFVLAFAHL
jgi:hypothetical protein